MQSQPGVNLMELRRAAGDRGTLVAVSLGSAAAQTLTRCMGLHSVSLSVELTRCLNALGVERVFVDDGQASAQTDAEASALTERFMAGVNLPLLMSSCPNWRRQTLLQSPSLDALFCEIPPDTRCRGLAIRAMLCAQAGVPFSSIIHVTVVECPAQKARYHGHQARARACIGDEYVITVRELLLWLGLAGRLPEAMPDASNMPPPSQGRLHQVLARAVLMQSGQPLSIPPLNPVAGHSALCEGVLPFMGRDLRFAQLRGLHEAPWLMEQLMNQALHYDLLEVFTCLRCG